MKQRKNVKGLKVTIIAISIVIVLIGIFIFLYLQTDMLKGNKTLFFKYITQMGDSKTSFIDEDITQYFEKKANTPYANDGTFNPNIEISGQEEKFKPVNNLNISFTGKMNNTANKIEQNISLNYSKDVKFPFMFRKIEDKVGIQTEYIGKNIVAIDTNSEDIEDLDSIIEINNTLGKLKEIKSIEITEQEKEQITNKYVEILKQSLDDTKFSQVKEADNTGYKLTLTTEELKNIASKLLEIAKDDETVLNKLNKYLEVFETTIEKSDIEDAIEELNNAEIEDSKQIEITLYNKGGKLNKLQIVSVDFDITIQKIKGNDNTSVSISFEIKDEENTLKLLLAGTFTGLKDMQNVQEAYQLTLEMNEKMKLEYVIGNKVAFAENTEIEDFSEDNSILLNDFEEEQVSNFLQAVQERIAEVNRKQMEELGLEESENPLSNVFPFVELLSSVSSLELNTTDDFESNIGIDTLNQNLDETTIATFNSEYEMYADTNSPGVTTKGLMTIMDSNNEKDGYKIKEINFKGEEYEATKENISKIKQEISTEKNYKIEFEKDENTGAIYRAIINEK